MTPQLPARLLHMAAIAKKSKLENLAAELVKASHEVAGLLWEVKVLKKKRKPRHTRGTARNQ